MAKGLEFADLLVKAVAVKLQAMEELDSSCSQEPALLLSIGWL